MFGDVFNILLQPNYVPIVNFDYSLIWNTWFFMFNKTIWAMFLFFSWFLSIVPLFGLNFFLDSKRSKLL